MKKIAILTLGVALCSAPAFSQAGAAAAASPPAPQVLVPAFAQQGDFAVDIFGGVNASATDRDIVPSVSGSAGVQAIRGMGHRFSLTGTFVYDDIGKVALIGGGTANVNAKEFEIGLQRAFMKKGRIEPYFLFDVGGIYQNQRLEGRTVVPGSTVQFAVAPGLGFLLGLNRFVTFDFRLRAVVPAESNPLPWQIQGLVGVVFRKPASR